MRCAALVLVAAAVLGTVEPLALKRRGGLTKSKKKKKLKKAPPPVAPAPVARAPRAPLSWSLSPEEHMAAVSNAVESAADGIQTALADNDFFSRTDFLDARSVAASAQIMPTTPSTRHLLDGVAACTRLTDLRTGCGDGRGSKAPGRHARPVAVDAV